MAYSNDYLSNVKYEVIYNILRFNGAKLSRTNISLIINNVYVNLTNSVSQSELLLLKNLNTTIEVIFRAVKARKSLSLKLMESLINNVLNNMINFNFFADSYQKFAAEFAQIKWQGFSTYDYLQCVATIFLEVINKRIFKEYSYTIAIIFAFAFPLFHRIEPIIIKYIDKKEFEAVVKENDVKTLVSWFKAMQDFESAKIRMLKE